jgi:hypothetical protein
MSGGAGGRSRSGSGGGTAGAPGSGGAGTGGSGSGGAGTGGSGSGGAGTGGSGSGGASTPACQVDASGTAPGGSWIDRTPATGNPSPRYGNQLASLGGGRALLFSGIVTQDTWLWDSASGSWQQLSPPAQPPQRAAGAMVRDELRGKVLLFGGTDPYAGKMFNDLWEWDPLTGRWTELVQPALRPVPREQFGMAFDTRRNRLVVVGGDPDADAVWEWDGSAWSKLIPPPGPGGRGLPAITYDPSRERVVLYGGAYDFSVWEWDGTAWLRRCAASSGPPRFGAGLAPTGRGTLLLMGGYDDEGRGRQPTDVSKRDTWEWNGATLTWRKLSVGSPPPPREIMGMVFDAARGRVLLFGGGYGEVVVTPLADTWEYTPLPAP